MPSWGKVKTMSHPDRVSKAEPSLGGLLTLALLSIWLNAFGVGFIVLRLAKRREGGLSHEQRVAEDSRLALVRVLGVFSVVLFVLTWLGFICMLLFHHPH